MVEHIPTIPALATRIDRHEARIETLEEGAKKMSDWKTSIDKSIEVQQEILKVGRDIAGALHVLGWIGGFVKWLAIVGAAVVSIRAAIKGWWIL